MSRKITFDLSVASVRQAQKELMQYKRDLLAKCETFVTRLSEIGIRVAKQNLGQFGSYIVFDTEVDDSSDGIKAVLVATNTGLIHSEWRTADGTKSADVSPILMAEFGSGLRAKKNPFGEHMSPKMGTGTFPDQTHAEDPQGWWYQTLDGEWHHSYGVTPTMPMYKASAAIFDNVRTVAREVFGS